MSCGITGDRLLLHDAGELSGGDSLSAHVAACAECLARLRELRVLGALVARGTVEAPSEARRARVLLAAGRGRWRIAAWLLTAAAAAVLIVINLPGKPDPVPEDPWIARHRDAIGGLGRPAVEIARASSEPSAGAGLPDTPDETARRAAAREAVAAWQSYIRVELLFPAFVPAGVHFCEAAPDPDASAARLTFAGDEKSFSIFLAADTGGQADRAETLAGADGKPRALVARTVGGTRVVLLGYGLDLEELKRVATSLKPVKEK